MHRQTRRRALVSLAAAALIPFPAKASTLRYDLDRSGSRVGFRFFVGGVAQAGTMPVRSADIVIDPDRLGASRVDVTLDVAGARTGLPLATQAMIGPEILDAARHPIIRFRSRAITLSAQGRLSGGARISGDLTVRGVTRTVTLDADVFRARGSAPDDLSVLTVQLQGAISRSAFGASGFAALVDDRVALDITALMRSRS